MESIDDCISSGGPLTGFTSATVPSALTVTHITTVPSTLFLIASSEYLPSTILMGLRWISILHRSCGAVGSWANATDVTTAVNNPMMQARKRISRKGGVMKRQFTKRPYQNCTLHLIVASELACSR